MEMTSPYSPDFNDYSIETTEAAYAAVLLIISSSSQKFPGRLLSFMIFDMLKRPVYENPNAPFPQVKEGKPKNTGCCCVA